MKVLLINGSPNQYGCTYTALSEAAEVFNQNGIETEIMYLGKKPVAGCIDCGHCGKTRRCVFDDQVNTLIDRADEFDGMIVGSPVYYAGASGQISAFLDRLFFAGGGGFQNKPGAAIVSCRRGGATAAFDELNKYFTINNMPIVSSQYWNQVHGCTPEEVKQDVEGMQTVRTLAYNMTWLLQCIEAGKKAGVPMPKREPRVFTNFIR